MSRLLRQAIAKWDYNDLVVCYLLSQRLPDSTAVHMGTISTAQLRWYRVTDEFTAKSVYTQNNLESSFYKMHCMKGGDVRAFLGSLRYKREELAAAGVHITNKEYQRTVLKGIPEELARFASGLLSSARLVHRASSIDTETLIDHICEEANRLRNRRAEQGKPQSSQSGARGQAAGDDALAATGSEGNKKKRRK